MCKCVYPLSISFYRLSAVFLLVDGNDGFHSVDQTAIEMLEEYGKPYAVSDRKGSTSRSIAS